MNRIARHLTSPSGQTITEYALILALLVASALAVLPLFGGSVLDLWNRIGSAVGGP